MKPSIPWRRIGAAIVGNVGLQVASAALMFVATALLGRWLGASGVGVYAVGMAAVTIGSIAARLGLEAVIVRNVAVGRTERDGATLHAGLVTAFGATLVAAGAVGLGLATGPWLLGVSTGLAATLTAAGGLLVGLTASTIGGAFLRGLGRVVIANVPNLGIRPLGLCLALLVVWLGGLAPQPWVAMALHAAAAACGTLVMAIALAAAWPTFEPRPERSVPRIAGSWLAEGLPLLVLGGLGVLNRQTDIVMMGALASAAQTGAYSVSAQIAGLATYVLQASNNVVAPRFAQLDQADDRPGLQRLVAGASAGVLAVTLPLALALGGLAEPLLAAFGPGFETGATALRVLLVGGVLNAGAGPVAQLLLMTRRDRFVVRTFVATALVNVALNALLVPRFGALGAALATTAATALWNLVLVAVVRAQLGIDPTIFGLLRRSRSA